MPEEKHEMLVYLNGYMSLWSDGTIGLNDGVGYLDSLSPEEVRSLYEDLKEYFEKEFENKEGKV